MSDQGDDQDNALQQNQYSPQQTTKQVLIRLSDMPPQDQCTAVSIANSSIQQVADLNGISQTQKYSKIAGILKRQLDSRLGDGFYVICGKNFGTYVTHEKGSFIHFSFDELHFCCFRAN